MIASILKKTLPASSAMLIGVGIASGSRKCLSSAVPIDLMAFILRAEHFRSRAELVNGIVLVADNPKMYEGLATPEAVSSAASKVANAVQLLLDKCGLNAWRIIRGSSFATDPKYLDLARMFEAPARKWLGDSVPAETVRYFAGQTADIEFMRRHLGVSLKFGWGGVTARGEKSFDDFYQFVMSIFYPEMTSPSRVNCAVA